MDDSMYAVLLSIIILILYILVPLIPSVLIYKVFPDTKVTITGPLANLTLRASGAFAAYVVVVGLCYSPFEHSEELIAGLAYPTWTITGSVMLVDTTNQPWPHQENFLTGLGIITKPDLATTSGRDVVISIPGITDPRRTIAVIVPGFGQAIINLQKLDKNKIVVDNFHKHLDVGQIRIEHNFSNSTSYSGSDSRKLPDAGGPPPPTQ